MRRVILGIALMMITFGVGLGIDRLASRTVSQTPQMQACAPATLPPLVETVKELTPPPPPPPSSVETPNAVMDYEENKFYPEGSYSLVGPIPKEFRQFQFFLLESTMPVDGRSGYLSIGTGFDDSYDVTLATFALVTRKRVLWVGPPMTDGFEYRFDGEFLAVNFDKAEAKRSPVLRGTLTKTKGGKRVAERVVSFSIAYDHC